MSFITTARALDDERFKWRVRAAAVTVAAGKITGTGPDAAFAVLVFQNPMGQNAPLEALVAANPTISAAVTVDEHDTVDTSGVPDGDIEYAVTAVWAVAAKIHGVAGA